MTIHLLPRRLPQRGSPPRTPQAQTSKAGSIAPELLFMILEHVRHPTDPLPDRPHVLPTLRAVPLVCKAWNGPGTEFLYQRVVFLSPSSKQTKMLARTIRAKPRLGRLVNVLCFPDLRFRVCDYYRNERSGRRLLNYSRLVLLCPNLTFLRFPANLQNAFSPLFIPGLPLETFQTQHLQSLHLSSAVLAPALNLLPIHSSLPSLVHLTLKYYSFTLEQCPPSSRLLFPSLPRLRSLSLHACLLDTRAASQIFSAVRSTLVHLELWYSAYLPEISEVALNILGPTLQSLFIDEICYKYLVERNDYFSFSLNSLTSFKFAAESLSLNLFLSLPPRVEHLRIIALPVCSCDLCDIHPGVHNNLGDSSMGHTLSLALSQNFPEGHPLKEIAIAGRCCAWHKWESVLEERCASRNIDLMQDTIPGACALTPVQRHLDAINRCAKWPICKASSSWNNFWSKFAW